jgi:CubicO group peptidase (beta-lactamase class C family)
MQHLLDEWLHSFTKQHASALSVSIFTSSHIFYEKAFGTFQDSKPNHLDTVYPFCSISKSFTSSIFGFLQHNHRLELQQTIRQFIGTTSIKLPLPSCDDWSNKTNIEDILTHRSGIQPQNDLHLSMLKRIPNIRSYLQFMFNHTSCTNTNFDYNNFMYVFLVYLLTCKFQTSWPHLLHLITIPLGLHAIYTSPPKDRFVYSFQRNQFHCLPDYFFQTSSGSGGVLGTIQSLRQWIQAWMSSSINNVIGNDYVTKALSPQAYFTMYNEPQNIHNYYGLGWMGSTYKGFHRFYHDGNIKGYYSSNMCFFPQLNLGIAILSNSGNFLIPILIRNRIADAFIRSHTIS